MSVPIEAFRHKLPVAGIIGAQRRGKRQSRELAVLRKKVTRILETDTLVDNRVACRTRRIRDDERDARWQPYDLDM